MTNFNNLVYFLLVFVTCCNDQTCKAPLSSLCWTGCYTNFHIVIISYIVQYPILGIAQSALYFTPWAGRPVQLNTITASLGSIQPCWKLVHEDYSYMNIYRCLQPDIHSYSELEQCRMKIIAQGLTW